MGMKSEVDKLKTNSTQEQWVSWSNDSSEYALNMSIMYLYTRSVSIHFMPPTSCILSLCLYISCLLPLFVCLKSMQIKVDALIHCVPVDSSFVMIGDICFGSVDMSVVNLKYLLLFADK